MTRAARIAVAAALVVMAMIALPVAVSSPSRATTASRAATTTTCRWMDTKASASQRAHELVAAMTLDQKISELYGRGDFIYDGAADMIPAIPTLCVPALYYNDAGAGVADVQTNTTAFPDSIGQAASWDPRLQRRVGKALGREDRKKGGAVQLAPGIDIARNPLAGRDFEYAGEDPYLAGRFGAAVIKGIQSEHVVAAVKHYALNDQETNRMTDSSDASQRTMQEIDLPAFQAAVKAGVGSVMCGYNRVNGVYDCQNKYLLKTVLDKQFGFQGWVMSDWGGTHSTAAAANNGLDEEHNATAATYFVPKAMNAAIAAGKVSIATVDEMVYRKMYELFKVGVFDHPPAAEPAADSAVVDTPAEAKIALTSAEAGTVLLQNRDHALPLRGSGKHIAVIGQPAGATGAQFAYQGGGSSKVPVTGTNTTVVTPLQGITTRGLKAGDTVSYADGSSTAAAVAAAATANVAIVFASAGATENRDRSSLALDDAQCTLATAADSAIPCSTPSGPTPNTLISAVAKANPNTIVVVQSGAPVSMPWLHQVKSVVETWYPGQEDGNAAAAVVFGDVDPSGKLPYTFPKSLAHSPIHSTKQWPGVMKPADSVGPHSSYSEKLLVGYRWYQAKDVTPMFPFGFGLSYTKFRFTKLRLRATHSGAIITAKVTNIGSRTGADVAQLYVADPARAGEPPLQLKGFSKVTLKPSQSKTVSFTLDRRSFARWRTSAHRWTVTPGCYGVRVGDSSAHLPLHSTLARSGGHC
jgi:beta-glucosidase